MWFGKSRQKAWDCDRCGETGTGDVCKCGAGRRFSDDERVLAPTIPAWAVREFDTFGFGADRDPPGIQSVYLKKSTAETALERLERQAHPYMTYELFEANLLLLMEAVSVRMRTTVLGLFRESQKWFTARTSMLDKAITLAKHVHRNQFDKGRAAYIQHPLRVMEHVEGQECKMVAVLHDSVEDSSLTLEHLAQIGFPPAVIQAIDAITKREGETYDDYLDRVSTNKMALQVKIVDMTDNSDLSRIKEPTGKDRKRVEKYARVLPRLQERLIHFGRSG